jgi:type I restriction enzyme S subunit
MKNLNTQIKNQKLPKGWQKVKLGEVFDLKYGFGLPEKKRSNGNVPVFGSSGIIGVHDQPVVKSDGLIVGRKGHIGSIYYSDKPFYPIDTVYFVDKLKIPGDLKFFYYFLQRIPFKKIGSDVGVPGLNREIAYNLDILIPENPEEQKRIASILSAFDDKIELNNKISRTLEQMAQEIFREWFNKNSKFKMQNSKLKGWKVGYLGDGICSEIIKSGIKNFIGEKIYLATADVTQNEILNERIKITYNNRPIRANMEPTLDSVWFAKMINTYKVLFFFEGNKDDIAKYILSTGFMGIKALMNMQYYLYFFINSGQFHRLKDTLVQGAVQEAITNTNVKEIKFLIPPANLINNFNEKVDPLIKKVFKNKIENQKLAELRDLLLPKLMSGEIRIKK